MAFIPPPGFVDLSAAYSQKDQLIDVMGVVVDHLPAAKSNGADCVITFTIHDPSWTDGLGLKFRYFQKDIEKLPAIEKNGDVVLLRNVKIKNYRGGWTGISNKTSTWAVFPESSLPDSTDVLQPERVTIRKSSLAACPTRVQ